MHNSSSQADAEDGPVTGFFVLPPNDRVESAAVGRQEGFNVRFLRFSPESGWGAFGPSRL
jgi:hypothetical protein